MLNRIYTDNHGKSRQGNFELFFEMSIDNYLLANELNERKCLLQSEKVIVNVEGKELEIVNFDILEELFKIQDQQTKHEIQCIISLAIFIEATINEIGITKLGSKYFKQNLDRLSVLSKWEITLSLIFGQSLNKDSEYYKNIGNVIKVRNSLVHYKSKQINEQNNYTPSSFLSEIKETLFSMKALFNDLKLIDKEEKIIDFMEIEIQLKRLKR